MSLTRDLGQFVSDLSPNRVPEEAVAIARTGFIDTVGVMFAGREEEPTRLLQDVLQPAAGPATLYFGEHKAGAPEAAWINGVAAHALDYDDVALRGHPSAVLVPAILAEAETLDASGRDMLVAYVAGYEVWPSWRSERPATTTTRAGTRPASSAPSPPPPPARICAGWTRCRPRRRSRSARPKVPG